ncbi:BRE1 E3 ubiquitin ligase-domain-containing protein [Dipodascopsis tothii]|uniref:BRE1 E3 ubiquitin ligase-domain-containing protein n=1 Tax=Dipodascopsis tothii TaxID=44089 RepID=UPI0034CEFC49
MDDRKRALAAKADPDIPPPKRQALESDSSRASSSNGPNVPLTQEDVELFKKEAIFRQMQVYRRERDVLQAHVQDIEQRAANHDDHLRLIEAWWDQLLDEVRLRLDGKVNAAPSTAESLPKSLLLATSEEYASHVASKKDAILEVLGPLFAKLDAAAGSVDAKELYSNISELSLQIKLVRVENGRLQDEKENLERRLTDATFKYMTAAKRLDRLKSQTLAKIERTATPSPTIKREGSVEDKPEVEKKVEAVDEDTVAQIRKEYEGAAARQVEEIRGLQARVAGLLDDISKLNVRIAAPTETDVVQSEPYKVLKLRYEDVAARASHLEALNDVIKQESEKLSSERTEYRELLGAEYKAVTEDLQKQLKKSEQDLIRIRAARDELLQELAIRKAKDEQKTSALREVTELAETRAARIESLGKEIERLQEQVKATDGQPTPSDESREELLKRIDKLEKTNKSLAAELPSLEAAFNKAHQLSTRKVLDQAEREEKMLRLVAEKAKADQKYFAAMRAKEAVALENKALKAQGQASGKVVQQLRDAERAVSHKVSALERQLAELESVRLAYQRQLQDAAKKAAEQAAALDHHKVQIDKLYGELQARSAAIGAEADRRRSAEDHAERLRVDLERAKPGSAAVQLNGNSDQLEALRSIAICSVCSKNWKNTAIKVCGHCFCLDCAKDRLNARLRKCPLCNKQYSHNDLMTIHL